jgi:hypothetical protein
MKKIFLIIFTLTTTISSNAQGQWVPLNSGITNSFTSVYFTSSDTEQGNILLSCYSGW